MFLLDVPELDYADPWRCGFDTRLAELQRCKVRIAYFYERPDSSTFRYRIYNVVQALGASSRVSASWFSLADMARMDRVIEAADALVFCRTRYDDRVSDLLARARAHGRRVLFDIDDFVFDPASVHLVFETLDRQNSWDYWFAYCGRLGEVARRCDAAIATNDVLAARLAGFLDRPVSIIPNFMNREQLDISERLYAQKRDGGFGRDGRIHLGYFSGSPSHNRDFDIVSEPLAALMDEDSRIVLRVVGHLDPRGPVMRHADRVEILPFTDFVNLQRLLAEVEINLMPLQRNAFTECKSELKYFEAAAVGTISVASPTEMYARAIADGRTGFLARAWEWKAKLRQAIDAFDRYPAMAAAIRRDALARFTWDRQTAAIERVFLDALARSDALP